MNTLTNKELVDAVEVIKQASNCISKYPPTKETLDAIRVVNRVLKFFGKEIPLYGHYIDSVTFETDDDDPKRGFVYFEVYEGDSFSDSSILYDFPNSLLYEKFPENAAEHIFWNRWKYHNDRAIEEHTRKLHSLELERVLINESKPVNLE